MRDLKTNWSTVNCYLTVLPAEITLPRHRFCDMFNRPTAFYFE
jgi:hypothetical protein